MRTTKGTRPLQRWTTIKGVQSSEVVQPSEGWIDGSDFDELGVWLEVTSFSAVTPAALSLIVESAESVDSPTGAWEAIISTAAVTSAHAYAASKESASTHFSRFIRWRVNAQVCGDWSTTFRVCATLK
jgi:hypothetical protein